MRKTNTLILLAVISLVGIIVSQVYWINNAYSVSKTQFLKNVRTNLKEYEITALLGSLDLSSREDDSDEDNDIAPADRAVIGQYLKMHASVSNLNNKLDENKQVKEDVKFILHGVKDKNLTFFDNSQVEESYTKQELNEILLKQIAGIKGLLFLSKMDSSIELTITNSVGKILAATCKDTVEFNKIKDKSDYFFIGTNTLKAQIAFKKLSSYVLNEMAGLIIVSILLIIISTLALWLMLRTIFIQNRLSVLKNDFVNNMTHELKTPISTVTLAIEAIQKFKVIEDPKKTNEYLNIANNELSRLTIMVDKILKTASFERNETNYSFEKIDLNELSKQVIKNFDLQFVKHKVQFIFSCYEEHLFLNGDRAHLSNVIYNLIDNAIKYSSENPIINVVLRSSGSKISLSVADNGIGIPEEFQAKIFDKFFRVPTGNIHNVKGYGLGLSYVKSVIDAHSGNIHLSSVLGKGTTFIVEFKKYDN